MVKKKMGIWAWRKRKSRLFADWGQSMAPRGGDPWSWAGLPGAAGHRRWYGRRQRRVTPKRAVWFSPTVQRGN